MSDKYPGGFVTLTTPTGANALLLLSIIVGFWQVNSCVLAIENSCVGGVNADV